VLIVHAHREPQSLNGDLTRQAVTTLTGSGHTVHVNDLYAIGFDPVANTSDYTTCEDPAHLRTDSEQTWAHRHDAVAPDIAAEQHKLAAADLLILQYPTWWFSMPAILKTWADRVLACGFACQCGHPYDTGLMPGKKAMVSVTIETSAGTSAHDLIDGSLLDVLWPVHNGLLRYSGFEVLQPFATHAPGEADDDTRAHVLRRYDHRLRHLDAVPALVFHPHTDAGQDERLLPGVTPASGFQHRR